MSNIEKAIKLAGEGGWNKTWYFSHFNDEEVALGDINHDSENNPCYYIDMHKILLDPLFWQALGKALGWNNNCSLCNSKANGLCSAHRYTTWQAQWHRFIDHRAEGRDPDSFFASLLQAND